MSETDNINEKTKDILNYFNEQAAVIFGVDKEELLDNASITEDLDGDSLDICEIIFAVEDEFSLEIADESLFEIKTIRDLRSLFNCA